MSLRTHKDRLDPALHLVPQDQLDRVFRQDMCDIDPEFLGFTQIYIALATIIPKHWTIVDLGCAFAPQAFIFKSHKAYVGVDPGERERFSAPNTRHYEMTTGQFIERHGSEFDRRTTFAICSYVPPWFGENSREIVRGAFTNVFTFYPSGDHQNVSSSFARPVPIEDGGTR